MALKNKKLTLKEIRDQMLRINKTLDETIRPLNIDFILNDHGKVGTVFFSLNGSPPKGYAIYIPSMFKISFYELYGEHRKKLDDIEVPQIDRLLEKEKYKAAQYIFGGNVEKDPEYYGFLTILPKQT